MEKDENYRVESDLLGELQVPTNANGLSALLTMINSCANGIAVVNIDNGYGAGYIATQINRMGVHKDE